MGDFICKDKGVEDFLHTKAFDFDKRNVSRTYLLVDRESLTNPIPVIAAYFTLAIKPLSIQHGVSKNMIKEIDGFSKNATSVGAVLIGQLGKNLLFDRQIAGSNILDEALRTIRKVCDIAGSRIVFLECEPLNKLIAFYENNNFVRLQKNETNGLLQMIRFL
jgi:hypothetical protein